ncbi:MAG TPA: hypothetical protein VG895_05325 [Patescibacteria group bacterium]|nr:hypothetical protein [Patescibacteria group bacterium]
MTVEGTYEKSVRSYNIYCDFLDTAIDVTFPGLIQRLKELSKLDWEEGLDLGLAKLEARDSLKANGTFNEEEMREKACQLVYEDEQTIQDAINEYRQSLSNSS